MLWASDYSAPHPSPQRATNRNERPQRLSRTGREEVGHGEQITQGVNLFNTGEVRGSKSRIQ